jgi:hypothetical protein
MKRVKSRTITTIVSPLIAVAVFAPAANAAAVHAGVQSMPAAASITAPITGPAATVPTAAAPATAPAAPTASAAPAAPAGWPWAPATAPVPASSPAQGGLNLFAAAGTLWGLAGLVISKVPVIGPLFDTVGAAATALFEGVPLIGDFAKAALSVYDKYR